MRAEIIERIEALKPNWPSVSGPGGSFAEYTQAQALVQPITEFQGCPRVFQIMRPEELDPHFYVGGGTVGRTYVYPLIIVYRLDEEWSTAMMDDVESIRSSLLTSTDGGTSGVQARYVARDTVVEVTEHDEDPWQYVTIPIWAVFEIS
jgi:hypothetical protein